MFIKRGFTLIELLIVMAILGILATVGFGNFMQSRVKAKDIARKQDLQTIAKSLEAYANDKRSYPNTGTLVWGSAFSDTTVTPATIYASRLPTDPGGYSYLYEKSGSGYYLYAYLENSQDSAVQPEGTYTGKSCGSKECNYRISSSNL